MYTVGNLQPVSGRPEYIDAEDVGLSDHFLAASHLQASHPVTPPLRFLTHRSRDRPCDDQHLESPLIMLEFRLRLCIGNLQ